MEEARAPGLLCPLWQARGLPGSAFLVWAPEDSMVVRGPETWLPGQCCQLRVVAGMVLQCLCLQGVMNAMTSRVFPTVCVRGLRGRPGLSPAA